jgi:hypothetical protein
LVIVPPARNPRKSPAVRRRSGNLETFEIGAKSGILHLEIWPGETDFVRFLGVKASLDSETRSIDSPQVRDGWVRLADFDAQDGRPEMSQRAYFSETIQSFLKGDSVRPPGHVREPGQSVFREERTIQ